MKIAVSMFEYFPYGGLQRDALSLALHLRDRGYQVTCCVDNWSGSKPEGIEYLRIQRKGMSNHARSVSFSRQFQQLEGIEFDVRVGFNRMLGLDFYFAADPCYAALHASNGLKAWLPRYRTYLQLERQLIEESNTSLFCLTPQQISDYQSHYDVADDRFILVPPGIDRLFSFTNGQYAEWRQYHRQQWQLEARDHLLLAVGSNFRLKGLARSLKSLAALPDDVKSTCHLAVAGEDDAEPYQQLADKLGLAGRVHFLGARDDIHELMAAADVLLHPSDYESAGMVLVEAIVSGIPVVVTETCGYAFHVKDANMGAVLSMPFEQDQMNLALEDLIRSLDQNDWIQRARIYNEKVDLFGLNEVMTTHIESFA